MICDVSKHQGVINWDKLAPKLDFVVIKASGKYANGADPYYASNVAGAVSHGVPFHAFHFLYCLTEAQAKRDAALFYNTVKSQGHMPLFWVLDCEKGWGIPRTKAKTIAETFEAELRRLVGKSIRVALYIGHDKYKEYAMNYSRYAYIWIPRYGRNDGTVENSIFPDHPCDLWQFTSRGKAPGINTNVDLDILTGTKPMSFFTGMTNEIGGETMATNYKKYILSTGTHYIANSGSDEDGKLHGGQAGDQTGKEFCLRSWYKRPWTCVLRYPDIRVATLIAQLAVDAALNDKIGYDQYQRDSFWKQLKKVGYLPSRITVACEEDCTAGVNAIVHAAAYLLGIAKLKAIPETGVRSSNMRKHFSAAGFEVLTESKYLTSGSYLLPGDILLYDNHHGATNVTAGKKVTYAFTDVISPFINGTTPDESLRRGDSGDAVTAMQKALLVWDPDCLPKWGADGDFGEETEEAVKAYQKAAGLPVTGVYDAATKKSLTSIGKQKNVLVTGGSVNVRTAPGYDTKVLGVAHKGDLLPYQGEDKTAEGVVWHLVAFKNQNAWISGKYSRIEA